MVKFKCDDCKHLRFGHGPKHMPYPELWCEKQHWTGWKGDISKEDPWKDCIDFEVIESDI